MGTKDFKEVVAKYICYQHSFHIWEKDKMQELVNKFGCKNENTIISWVLDIDSPGQEVEKVVVQFINSQTSVL